MKVLERDVPRLLTMERQFCTKCWAAGRRVRVFSAANRTTLGERKFRAARRRALADHLVAVHDGKGWAL